MALLLKYFNIIGPCNFNVRNVYFPMIRFSLTFNLLFTMPESTSHDCKTLFCKVFGVGVFCRSIDPTGRGCAQIHWSVCNVALVKSQWVNVHRWMAR